MLTLTNSSWRLVGFDEEALGERLGVVADFAESGLPKFLCPLPRPGEVNLVRPTVLLLSENPLPLSSKLVVVTWIDPRVRQSDLPERLLCL